jgi:hypothetical protein
MPSRNQTHRQKKRNSKTQKGGKRLYSSIDEYSAMEIEKIFCDGKLLSEMKKPIKNGPFFIIKWAPMASGKSSKKIMDTIERIIAPYPLESCADVSSDKLVENLLPFRYDTVDAKIKNIRAKADIELSEFRHAKQILQFHKRKLPRGNTNLQTIDSLIQGAGWPIPKKDSEFLLESLLQKRIRQVYNQYYRVDKNTNGKTLRDKVIEFFPRAYEQGVNVIYETAGLGYGESEQIGTLMARTRLEALKQKEANPIFKNTFADFLGEVVMAELLPGQLKPVGFQPNTAPGGHPELFIPQKYRIVIIFPIVSIDELVKRGYLRAYNQLYHPTLYDVDEQQKSEIARYIQKLLDTLTVGVDSRKSLDLEAQIDKILTREFREHSRLEGSMDYQKNLSDLLETAQNPEIPTSTFPFFRLTSFDIETAVAQAFQYSIDYFLSQYIQLGRIEQVIYVSNN